MRLFLETLSCRKKMVVGCSQRKLKIMCSIIAIPCTLVKNLDWCYILTVCLMQHYEHIILSNLDSSVTMAYSSSGKALKFSGKTLSIYSNLCRDSTLMSAIYYLPLYLIITYHIRCLLALLGGARSTVFLAYLVPNPFEFLPTIVTLH